MSARVRGPSAERLRINRRAEQQAESRRRIVEAAVDLHSSVGPAFTILGMIAERAGVQRNTLYAHLRVSAASSLPALAMERDPMPDAEPRRAIGGRQGEECYLDGVRRAGRASAEKPAGTPAPDQE